MNDDLLARLLTATDGPTGRFLLVHGARGSGKSWWADRAAERARSAGYDVLRAAGRDSKATAAVQAIIASVHTPPVCVVVDDIDGVDVSVRHDLRGVVDANGGIAVVSAASSAAFDGALAVRLEPLATDALAELLGRRGVAPRAAQRCASAAAGNPGLAISLADALSDAQRADLAVVPEMPRLAAEVANDLHERLRRLGERTCRALAVAAADEDGSLLAIRSALRQLGEAAGDPADPDGSLDDLFDIAEEAAIVDVVDARVSFVDPWLRLAAYHLVAPASRRAAHRALAAAYDSPRQGGARVRHLVAASNGPSDEVAQALTVVASAVARRGDRTAAVRMATQAAELSVTAELRSASLLRAIGWCLDGGDYLRAQRLVDELDGLDGEERSAAQEVAALLHGDDDDASTDVEIAVPMSAREIASWRGRHCQRLLWWADADAGHHGRPTQQIGGSTAAPAELWARAMALRHAGLVRDAAELAARTLSALPPGASQVRARWELLDADLAMLTGGRADPATTLHARENDGAARALAVRAALAASPTLPRDAGCIHVPARDPLRGVRSEQLRGVATADHHTLAAAAAAAEAHGLPIEAGESWLMAAELAASAAPEAAPEFAEYARKAADVLHRCAVRCWDARLQSVVALARAAPPTLTPTVVSDPAVDALSAAEWRVAASVAEGLTNREVAAALFLSVKTVDFHLQQIYRKLALRSRTELAVRFAGRTHGPARRSPPTAGART
ncbi:MAG: helix-turn-helix transcriptional regulator [Actinomycetota bacterium]|nr:helix-turn-helix transcriptional regulator [Actinomycetota bacterium]